MKTSHRFKVSDIIQETAYYSDTCQMKEKNHYLLLQKFEDKSIETYNMFWLERGVHVWEYAVNDTFHDPREEYYFKYRRVNVSDERNVDGNRCGS